MTIENSDGIVNAFDKIIAGKVRNGRIKGVIAGLPVGGPYTITLQISGSSEKGNVIPGLAIALLGVIANSLFWRKYTRLGKQTGSAILAVQGRLYRAKTLVDGCVVIALSSVLLLPGSALSARLDTLGSAIVSLYLLWCGIKTIREVF